MSVHLPRVAAKLGADFHEISAEDLRRACMDRVAEDVHLDFKAEDAYTATSAGLDELAKDVTAMANAQGGLLVIGVAEDQNGDAVEIRRVDLSAVDRTINKMHQGLRARVVPLYPAVEIRAVEDPDMPGFGFYLIGIPRSALAPHAVRRTMRPEYSYALRIGRITTWLEETEIASRYRDRFRQAEDHVARVRGIFTRGNKEDRRLSARPDPLRLWLDLAAVPAIAAERRVDLDFIRQLAGFYEKLAKSTPMPPLVEGFLGCQPAIRRGSVRVSHGLVKAEWYADGSCFMRNIVSVRLDSMYPRLNFTKLEIQILALLHMATSYADWAGAYGDIDVLAATAGAPIVISDLLAPTETRSLIERKEPDPTVRSSDQPTHLTAPLRPMVDDPVQLLISAHAIAADLLADYGLAETTFIRPDGSLRFNRLDGSAGSQLRAWMRDVGLPVE